MKTIGAFDAKTHLSRLLDEVANGEEYVITRHGVPVAKLTSPHEVTRRGSGEIVKEWEEYRRRENITLGGLSIREMIEEGRRY